MMRYFLQSIAEKMKRHILAMSNIENSMDGEDAEESQRLLLAQEQEYKTTQRFGDIFLHFTQNNGVFMLISNAENLTYLLSWNNGFCCILDNVSIEAIVLYQLMEIVRFSGYNSDRTYGFYSITKKDRLRLKFQ